MTVLLGYEQGEEALANGVYLQVVTETRTERKGHEKKEKKSGMEVTLDARRASA